MKRQYCVKKQLYCNQLQNKQNQTQLIMKNCIIINFTHASFLFAQKMSRCCKSTGNPLPGVNIIEKELKTEFLLIQMDRTRLK
jgi:hypothetical protein